jgi:ABC-type sugar transport system ATPase subunit
MSPESRVTLAARDIEKTFGITKVLDGVDLELSGARVDGLIGRNGAGKSTLVNVLTGRIPADGGTVVVDGAVLPLHHPSDALNAGIVAVPQEIIMPMGMTVAEVVTFGYEPRRFGVLSLVRERREVRELLREMGVDIDVHVRVRDLSVSLQRVVLVAQALYRKARVLILDEPTAAMNAEDAERVIEVVRRVRERGVAVLYISHRFDEIERICDRVTAMADGRVIDVMSGDEISHGRLVAAITGAEAAAEYSPQLRSRKAADESIQLEAVSGQRLRDVTMHVAAGEIVGVAGLAGSGVEEVFQYLSGFARASSGQVRSGSKQYSTSRQATNLGVALLPASRAQAVLGGESVLDNLSLPALRRFGRFGWLTVPAAWRQAMPIIEKLSLLPVAQRRMDQLSGGNQQRVLVGAKLLARPRFLLLEDPTVGVDVGARSQLHALLRQLADDGMGLLVGSSEPEELVGLCDRIIAIRRGRIAAEWPAGAVKEQQLLSAMTGSDEEVAVSFTPAPSHNTTD